MEGGSIAGLLRRSLRKAGRVPGFRRAPREPTPRPPDPGAPLGETRFALAQALEAWPAGRERAVALAPAARDDYGSRPPAVAEIDAWLRRAR
jgi:hypothetical protein